MREGKGRMDWTGLDCWTFLLLLLLFFLDGRTDRSHTRLFTLSYLLHDPLFPYHRTPGGSNDLYTLLPCSSPEIRQPTASDRSCWSFDLLIVWACACERARDDLEIAYRPEKRKKREGWRESGLAEG
jgi:hypothetical protein